MNLELCGMECVDLTKSCLKILGIHFCYNKILQNEKNFITHVKNIEKILRVWRMRNLTLHGKITIFKTLAISKIVHLALVTTFPPDILNHLKKIQKDFLWYQKYPRIKHSTLRNTYENGGLKNVDIEYKIISLQCSWIKKLFDNTTHSWKIIPHYLINVVLGNNFVFHSNLSINEIKHFSCHPILPSMIASECLWYNENIKIDGKTIYYQSPFSENGLNYVGQLFENNHVKTWLQIFNNVLYLNKMLHKFKKIESPLCSYCNMESETPLHLFYSCPKTKELWHQLSDFLSQDLHSPHFTPQSSIIGLYENRYQHLLLINHSILIFKFYIYNARNSRKLVFQRLITNIKKVREIEKNIISNYLKFEHKWRPLKNILN